MLRVDNDGALPGDDADVGTGLVALGRYLDEHAGRLDAGLADGRRSSGWTRVLPGSPVTGPIRLVLADDEPLTRGAVGALLGLEPDLEVVAEASTGDEAVAAVRAAPPGRRRARRGDARPRRRRGGRSGWPPTSPAPAASS